MANNTTNNDNLPVVNANTFNLYDSLMGLYKEIVGTEDDDFMSSSLVGYLTQSMTMFTRDTILNTAMAASESMLNTASKPSTVYNWARTFNMEVPMATPAHMKVYIILRKEDIITYSKPASYWGSKYFGNSYNNASDDIQYFIIDRGTPFYADSVPFSLERSIVVSVAKPAGDDYKYSLSASYCINETEITAYNEKATRSPFLKTRADTDNNTEYFGIEADLYQYEITSEEKYIATNNVLENKIHSYKYKDQLCKILAFYRHGNNPEQKVNLAFNQTGTNENILNAKYNITNDDTFELVFVKNSQNSAMLKSNTYLRTVIVTTLGAKGNFNFTNSLNYRFEKDDMKNIATNIVAAYETDGGTDTPTLQQIKESIISYISSRNAIVTEADLKKYFAAISYDAQTTGANIVFKKKRDDMIRRIFSAYLLLTDQAGEIIPTNTIDAVIKLSDTEGANAQFSKQPGAQIRFCNTKFGADTSLNGKDKYEFYESAPVIFSQMGIDNTMYYLPFYLMVRTSPVPLCKYIYNSCNESTSLRLTTLSHSFVEDLTPLTASVTRNTLLYNETRYTIKLNFSSSMTADALKKFTVKLNIGDKVNANKHQIIQSFSELEPDGNGAYVMTAYLDVDANEFDSGGTMINILTSERVFSLYSEVMLSFTIEKDGVEFMHGQTDDYLVLFENLENITTSDIILKSQQSETFTEKSTLGDTFASGAVNDRTLYVQYAYYSDAENQMLASLGALDLIGSYYPVADLVEVSNPNERTFMITTVFNNTSVTLHFRNSDITFSRTLTDVIDELIIKSVPVVNASFNTEEDTQALSSRINRYVEMLQENSDKLEPSTTYDLKFYNTCGRSYNTTSVKTNIDISLNVYINASVDMQNSSIESDIRVFIEDFVKASNDLKMFSLTNMVSEVKAQFPDAIKHIDILSLNNSFDQKIDMFDEINELNEVPEYLNVNELKLNFIK